MAFYENVFIARQDVSPQQVEQMTSDFTTVLTNQGGKITKTESWGLRTLAYKIKKNRKGHYVLLNIDAEPAAVAELERIMGLSEDVLRFLTIRVDELEEGPSVMMRRNDDRDSFDSVERAPRSAGPTNQDRGYRPRPSRGNDASDGDEE